MSSIHLLHIVFKHLLIGSIAIDGTTESVRLSFRQGVKCKHSITWESF